MTLEWLLSWWNLIYVGPFLLALMYLAVYTVSGLTFGDGDIEGGVEADADADVHADAEIEADGELEGDVHTHGGHTGHLDVHAPVMMALLDWLGVGRAPLSILLMVLFFTWGAIGFLTNFALRDVTPLDWLPVLASLPLALIGGSFVTGRVMRLVQRWMPATETYAHRRAELVGTSGYAIYDVSREFGLVSVRDKQGDLFQAACRVYPDKEPISKGERVLLVDYDTDQQLFYVTKYDVNLEVPAP